MTVDFRWSTTDRAMGAPAPTQVPGRRVAAPSISWADLFDVFDDGPATRVDLFASLIDPTSRGEFVSRFEHDSQVERDERPSSGLARLSSFFVKIRRAGERMTTTPDSDPNDLEGVDFVEWLLEH
jgi:hypothetical protein